MAALPGCPPASVAWLRLAASGSRRCWLVGCCWPSELCAQASGFGASLAAALVVPAEGLTCSEWANLPPLDSLVFRREWRLEGGGEEHLEESEEFGELRDRLHGSAAGEFGAEPATCANCCWWRPSWRFAPCRLACCWLWWWWWWWSWCWWRCWCWWSLFGGEVAFERPGEEAAEWARFAGERWAAEPAEAAAERADEAALEFEEAEVEEEDEDDEDEEEDEEEELEEEEEAESRRPFRFSGSARPDRLLGVLVREEQAVVCWCWARFAAFPCCCCCGCCGCCSSWWCWPPAPWFAAAAAAAAAAASADGVKLSICICCAVAWASDSTSRWCSKMCGGNGFAVRPSWGLNFLRAFGVCNFGFGFDE